MTGQPAGPPFPAHDRRCPYQALPLLSQCECGQSFREWKARQAAQIAAAARIAEIRLRTPP